MWRMPESIEVLLDTGMRRCDGVNRGEDAAPTIEEAPTLEEALAIEESPADCDAE